MRIGLGHLHMRPDDFWRMSLREFLDACDGYLESKGVRRGGHGAAPTREEVDELFARLDDQGRLRTDG
jgi:uncharacterized phage protein (TIGR02216 family)